MKKQGGFLISKIKTIGGRKFDKILQGKNIDAFNGAQGKILYVLWEFGSMTATEISRRTGLAKTTLTTMLSRMCDQQLITFKESSSDKRSAIISLTPKVNEMKEQYDAVTEEMENIYYNGFTDEEVQQFEGYLRRILSNLEVEDE